MTAPLNHPALEGFSPEDQVQDPEGRQATRGLDFLTEVLPAGFRQSFVGFQLGNVLARIAASNQRSFPGFSVLDHAEEFPLVRDFPDEFIGITNLDQLDVSHDVLRTRLEDQAIFERAGFWPAFMANIIPSIGSPENLIPVGLAIRASAGIRGATIAAMKAGAAGAALGEVGLELTIPEGRTAEEAVINTLAGALLGGAMGTIAGGVRAGTSKVLRRQLHLLLNETVADLRTFTADGKIRISREHIEPRVKFVREQAARRVGELDLRGRLGELDGRRRSAQAQLRQAVDEVNAKLRETTGDVVETVKEQFEAGVSERASEAQARRGAPDEPAPTEPTVTTTSETPQAPAGSEPILGVINNAPDIEAIQALGFTRRQAEAILARAQQRPFDAVDDLLEVNGIGQKTLDKVEARGQTDPEVAPTPAEAPPADPDALAARVEAAQAELRKIVEEEDVALTEAQGVAEAVRVDLDTQASQVRAEIDLRESEAALAKAEGETVRTEEAEERIFEAEDQLHAIEGEQARVRVQAVRLSQAQIARRAARVLRTQEPVTHPAPITTKSGVEVTPLSFDRVSLDSASVAEMGSLNGLMVEIELPANATRVGILAGEGRPFRGKRRRLVRQDRFTSSEPASEASPTHQLAMIESDRQGNLSVRIENPLMEVIRLKEPKFDADGKVVP
ncbi:MAG TPA: hypothetical protein VM537_35035, partial [Anaerolineae bacterium]|nr:hypothetical protein [Anaerolineae bacterium]